MKYSLRSISTRVWLGRWQFNWLSSRGPFVNRKRTETKMARSYSLRWACHCVCDCIYVRVYECAWSFDRNVSMHGSNFANRRSRRCGHLVSGHETTDTTHRIVLYFEDRQFHGNSILRYRSLRPTTELLSFACFHTYMDAPILLRIRTHAYTSFRILQNILIHRVEICLDFFAVVWDF